MRGRGEGSDRVILAMGEGHGAGSSLAVSQWSLIGVLSGCIIFDSYALLATMQQWVVGTFEQCMGGRSRNPGDEGRVWCWFLIGCVSEVHGWCSLWVHHIVIPTL